MSDLIKISDYCRRIRIGTGLSAAGYAKQEGVSHTYVTNVESGKMDKPSIAILTKLINTYHLTKEDLFKMDIDGYFIDEINNLFALQHPVSSIVEKTFKRQLANVIKLELEPKGYKIIDAPDPNKLTKKRGILKYDKNWDTVPLYDLRCITPNGNDCFVYIFTSAIREMVDSDYKISLLGQIANVESSIKYSGIETSNKQIDILYVTSSVRAYRIAKSILEKNKLESSIHSDVLYFDNRRGEK